MCKATAPPMTTLKKRMVAEVDGHKSALWALARRIHAHPEIGFQETRAAAWLTEFLERQGFRVQRGICDTPTAFKATYGKGRPIIGILAEYDALPRLGHACGHNIIATAAVGAGVAARHAVDAAGGAVVVFGTPAEEGGGGKVVMAERGAFRELDAAMMVHPAGEDRAGVLALACVTLEVEFFGRAAHAAAHPHLGVNALDALVLAWNGLNALRQHLREGSRVHGIITDGGEASNVIPAHAAASLMVRARDDILLDELLPKVLACFEGAAQATGARLQHRWGSQRFAAMRANQALAELYAGNMMVLGRTVLPMSSEHPFSTDMGNVSALVPSMHPLLAIAPQGGATLHAPEFARAAVSPAARKGMLDGAKAMAMTVADLLTQPDALRRVRDEFLASG